jgi:hypothetical protein
VGGDRGFGKIVKNELPIPEKYEFRRFVQFAHFGVFGVFDLYLKNGVFGCFWVFFDTKFTDSKN